MAAETASCFPWGTLEPSKSLAFVGREDDSIAAIRLQTGKPEWTSSDAAIPLMVAFGRLAAVSMKPNEFNVVLLDPLSGKPLARTAAVPFNSDTPPQFHAAIQGRQLRVEWLTSVRYKGGAALRQYAGIAPTELSHFLVVDPSNGLIVQNASTSKTATPRQTDSGSVQYLRQSQWGQGSWTAGDRTADLVESSPAANGTLHLRVSEREGRTTLTDLGHYDPSATPVVTADGLYVLAPTSATTSAPWRIFYAATGSRVGEVTLDPSARDVCLVPPRLYYVATAPATTAAESILRAIDIVGNRKLWEYSMGQRRAGAPPPVPR